MQRIAHAFLALILSAATPAFSQAPSTLDQAKSAVAGFLGGQMNPAEYQAGFVKSVLADIDGTWTSLPGELPTDLAGFVMACGMAGARIEPVSDFSFTITRLKSPVTWTYVALGGNLFSEQANQKQLFDWLGLGESPVKDEMRLTALRTTSGLATVYRPSPDVLVVQTNYQMPRLFVRCPTG